MPFAFVRLPASLVKKHAKSITFQRPCLDLGNGVLGDKWFSFFFLLNENMSLEFIIDEVTGKIYAQRTLDREERAVWRFVVLATDEGGEGLTGFTDVIINVWDINDNAPIFTCAPSCHGEVAENSVIGTSVMEMTATDLDDSAVGQNAVLSYRIVGSLDATNIEIGGVPIFSEMFTINPTTGTITVGMGGLDREQVESYLLVVEARDGVGMTGTGTATIQIKDVNDHAPRFTDHSCTARISENVLELAAEDKDTGENAQLTFSVVAGDQEQKFYMVSHKQEQRGTLRLKKRLDYERHNEQRFNLTLKVDGGQSNKKTFLLHCVVEVEDYNDHAPVFIPHFLSLAPLPEDITVGTSVARLVASDSDSGQNREITYSLSEESDPEGLFTINQSGVLSVARPLDRERIPQHHLVVIATDHGVPPLIGSATVQLPLLDVNDNGPEFEAAYSPVVRLNQTSSLLRAVDQDSPENGPPFHFTVPAEYRHSNDFYLQDNLNGTATLTALRTFDRERQKEFLIPIIMSDSGRPAKTVTSTLTVTIGDQNDHAHVAGEKKIFINSHRGEKVISNTRLLYSPLYQKRKQTKKITGVYHVSAHHDGWEDIRENVLNYDEEGGGEEDQVQPPRHTRLLRRDVPPTRLPAQGQARPSQLARRSLSFSSQDLARYLCEIIRDADQHPDTGPFDSLQVFSTEGGGSPAGSLSSFSSAGLDGGSGGDGGGEPRREETLGEWGPRFEKLRALYERAEASDL
uniref:Cadherin domain-containing protein n=1 Tax=Stegastes partitus TaxID=144197 RepID=A0A3B5AX65_9TELE